MKSALSMLLLSFSIVNVTGYPNYEVEVTFHSYANPSGRCAGCNGSTPTSPRCCDVPLTEPVENSCPTNDTCDVRLGYCYRQIGTTGSDCQNESLFPAIEFNKRTIDFVDNVLGLDNPILRVGYGAWRGLQILLNFYNCFSPTSPLCNIIDTVIIDIRTEIGIPIPETTYNGMANLVRITTSIEVKCANSFYGPDCSTRCPNFMSCSECGLSGFTGQFCEICPGNCVNGHCVPNEDNGFLCECELGYTGDRCETMIDVCQGINCNSGACVVGETNSPRCECNQGFTGEHCESVIDHCRGVNCNNGGCVEEGTGFRCDCQPGFTGDACTETDDCMGAECNNGRCVAEGNDIRCECESGFTGARCDSKISGVCEGVKCNNGTCVEEGGSFKCECKQGFSGEFCLAMSAKSVSNNTGPIAGGVVGTLIGIILIAIVVVIMGILLVKRADKKTLNGEPSIPGDNPSYGITDTIRKEDSSSYQEIPARDPKSKKTLTESFQERKFNNPIYGSHEKMENERDIYNPLYAADNSPTHEADSGNYYTTINNENLYDQVNVDGTRLDSNACGGGANDSARDSGTRNASANDESSGCYDRVASEGGTTNQLSRVTDTDSGMYYSTVN